MLHSDHSLLEQPEPTTASFDGSDEYSHSEGVYRSRWNRQPNRKEIILAVDEEAADLKRQRDLLLFVLLNRHGTLPSNLLFKMLHLAGVWPDKSDFIERTATLFHGTLDGTYYLTRPSWQGDNPAREIIYGLAPAALAVLREHNIPIISRHGGVSPLTAVHDFYSACATASWEVFVESQRLEFKDLTTILAHDKCPPETHPLSILVDGKALEPDAFFAIQDTRPEFEAWEIDRNHETIQDTSAAHTSYGRKIKKYIRAFETKAFEKHYGIPRPPRVRTVTTSEAHMRNMQRYVRSLKAPGAFYFAHTKGFGPNWKIPKDFLYLQFEDVYGKPAPII